MERVTAEGKSRWRQKIKRSSGSVDATLSQCASAPDPAVLESDDVGSAHVLEANTRRRDEEHESGNDCEAALGTLYDRLHLLQNPDSSRSGSDSAGSEGWSRRFSDKMAGWGERLRRKLRRGLGLNH